MWQSIISFTPDAWHWLGLGFCALCIGMAKTGVAGIYGVVVPIMALLFGGKASTGLVLPMLIMADVFAVAYYHRAARWTYILKLLPWTLAGILFGTWVGDQISDEIFKVLMGVIILGGIGIMVWLDWKKITAVPDHPAFAVGVGLLAGFATMVGNNAGAVMTVYLLSMHLPKNNYIGTGAWFFMIINLSKVPFHVFAWETISLPSLWLDLMMLPAIALGAFLGVKIVRLLSETFYRKFIIVVTAVSALLLFF